MKILRLEKTNNYYEGIGLETDYIYIMKKRSKSCYKIGISFLKGLETMLEQRAHILGSDNYNSIMITKPKHIMDLWKQSSRSTHKIMIFEGK